MERRVPAGERLARDACPRCGYIHYVNPVVCAGTICVREGKVLLIRRGVEPGAGLWSYPCGYVEFGEELEAAARRETIEETGLEVALEGLHGIYKGVLPRAHVVILLYRARVAGGSLRAGEDARDARFFAPEEIPWEQLAFQNTRQALREWLERR
jgi:ADP-ribose pyrophosphatase YjhB (NUDIX family)